MSNADTAPSETVAVVNPPFSEIDKLSKLSVATGTSELSMISPSAVALPSSAFTKPEICTLKNSVGSNTESLSTDTSTETFCSPAGIVKSALESPTKSSGASAVALVVVAEKTTSRSVGSDKLTSKETVSFSLADALEIDNWGSGVIAARWSSTSPSNAAPVGLSPPTELIRKREMASPTNASDGTEKTTS